MTDANFEVKYTLRIYEPATISELSRQYEMSKSKNKNEFFRELIELGLSVNGKRQQEIKKEHSMTNVQDPTLLLLDISKYITKQFKTLYINQNILQRLVATIYNIVVANNNEERLFDEKIEAGFYDDLPSRFVGVIDDLSRRYGLV